MSPLHLHVFTSPTRMIRGPGERTFSPVTSSLICGEREAVLVDSQYIKADVDALGDLIAGTGRRLTTIFITHGHADHYFGSGRLAERFPGVRVIARPDAIAHIDAHLDADSQQFTAMFGDDLVSPTLLPEPFVGDSLDLEGHKLRLVEVGQGDIAASTVVHIPELDAVVVGDVGYHHIHQMLGLGGPAEWDAWIASVDAIERLKPRTVVVGHKIPGSSDDEVGEILDGTRAYIRNFAEAAKSPSTAGEIVAAMTAKYPDHGNPTTLLFSAQAAVRARSA